MRIYNGCVCFVRNGDNILLLQRNHEPFKDKWDGLQGLVEFGESPLQAVKREVQEEAGLTITACAHRGHLLLYNVESDICISADLFVASVFEGEIHGSEEGDPVWVPLADIPHTDLIGFVHITMPLVLTPDTFLIGTIRHTRSGDPVSYELTHSRLGETRELIHA